MHAFNPSTQEVEAGKSTRVSSRTGFKATQRNPVSKTKQNKTKQNIILRGREHFVEGVTLEMRLI